METYFNTVTNTEGQPVNGATITVYVEKTGLPAPIFRADETTVLANPFLSGYVKSEGEIEFSAANGKYDIKIESGGDTDWIYGTTLSDTVNNKAAALLLSPTGQSTIFILGTDGGLFYSVTGAAPGTYANNGGAYCGTIIVPTGGDGSAAFLRDYSGAINAEMFGADASLADNSTAIQAAHDAATGALTFGEGKTYTVTSIVKFTKSNMIIDLNGSTIISNTAAVSPVQISDTAYVFDLKLINGEIRSGATAGRTLRIPYGLAYSELNVSLVQLNTSEEIISETYSGPGGVYDNRFLGGIWAISNAHTVHGVEFISVDTGRCNGNEFLVERYDRSGTKQFFNIECRAATNWNYDNKWSGSTFEVTNGGNIRALGARGFTCEDLRTWDLSSYNGGVTVAHLYDFDIYAGGLGSIGNKFRNCGRTDGTLGSSLYDINFGDCEDSTIEHCGSSASIGVTHNINNKRAVIIHDIGQTIVNRTTTNSVLLAPNGFDGNLNTVNYASGGELTIASGVITVTKSSHTVDTEADAATDDLDTITAGVDGQIVTIRPINDARDVVVKNATGNIRLNGAADFTMNRVYDSLTLRYDVALTSWIERSRSDYT